VGVCVCVVGVDYNSVKGIENLLATGQASFHIVLLYSTHLEPLPQLICESNARQSHGNNAYLTTTKTKGKSKAIKESTNATNSKACEHLRRIFVIDRIAFV